MANQSVVIAAPVQSAATLSEQARDALLRPIPRFSLRAILLLVLAFLAYSWALSGTEASPDELLKGIPNIIGFIVRLFPAEVEMQTIDLPLLSISYEAPLILIKIIETMQMALIGSSISMVLSLPFGLLAARNTSPHRLVYQTMRFILNSIRAMPDLIVALVFVSAVGLGPFPGVLTLSVVSIGFMGKMYAEAIEAIDPQQVLAVRATGASRLEIFRYAVIPQALPLVAAYGLYLFERNVSSASVLGIVGAGGVGFAIQKYMALFQFQKLMGALILIIITVTLVDRTSDYVRRKLI